jgi:hypothetical protein
MVPASEYNLRAVQRISSLAVQRLGDPATEKMSGIAQLLII